MSATVATFRKDISAKSKHDYMVCLLLDYAESLEKKNAELAELLDASRGIVIDQERKIDYKEIQLEELRERIEELSAQET